MPEVNREELLTALSNVQPGLAAKEIIEQSQSFVFKDGQVMTYNDLVCVSAPTELPEDLEVAVKADAFYKILSKLTDEEVTLEFEDKEMRVKGKRTNAGVVIEKDIAAQFKDLKLPKKWKEFDGKVFGTALAFCLNSSSSDMTKQILTCLHVDKDKIIASDNLRFTQYSLGSKMFAENMLIPRDAAKYLIQYAVNEVGVTPGWLHFSDGDVVFSCRTYEDKYPDVSSLLELDDGKELSFPKQIEQALDRAGVFSKEKFDQDEVVELIIKEGMITVSARGMSGWFKEKIKIKGWDHDPIAFEINPKFLCECLTSTRRAEVGDDRIKLVGEHFCHIVTLKQPKEKK